MSPAGSSVRRTPAAAPLVGFTIFTLLGLLGRKTAPTLSMAQTGDGSSDATARAGRSMPSAADSVRHRGGDAAPGEPKRGDTDIASGVRAYLIGLGLAVLLTIGSFGLSYTHLVYGPAIPVALIVFAVAQIGIHLVFFLHITTSPDNVNNTMALAFGVLILLLLIGGTLWIMGHMNANMMPVNHPMQMMP